MSNVKYVVMLAVYFSLFAFLQLWVFNPMAVDLYQQGVEFTTDMEAYQTINNASSFIQAQDRSWFGRLTDGLADILSSIWDVTVGFLKFFAGGDLVIQNAPAWVSGLIGVWNGMLGLIGVYLIIELIRGV